MLVLYGHLQRSQPWIRLGDVYSALVSLRDLGLGLAGGEGSAAQPLAAPRPQSLQRDIADAPGAAAGCSSPTGSLALDLSSEAGQQPSGGARGLPGPGGAHHPAAAPGHGGTAPAPRPGDGSSSAAANSSTAAGDCAPCSTAGSGDGNSTTSGSPGLGTLPSSPSESSRSDPSSLQGVRHDDQEDGAGGSHRQQHPGAAAPSAALLAYFNARQDPQPGGSTPADCAASDAGGDQSPAPAAAPAALLAFKDQLLAARLKLQGGAVQLSPAAQQLLAALVRYRDALLPLAGGGSADGWRGVHYMAVRCGAALTLLLAEPQLDGGSAELVLEDLQLSATLARLPSLEGFGAG